MITLKTTHVGSYPRRLLFGLYTFSVFLTSWGQSDVIFSSGYEPDSEGGGTNAIRDIVGLDQSTGFDWGEDLDESPGLGNYYLEYTGGTDSQRWARIIEEPGNPGNHVLWFNILEANASNGNGRVQASLYGNEQLKEFSFKNRLYLHEDLDALRQESASWSFLTLWEFWNNPNWTGNPYPFRVTVNLMKEEGIGSPLRVKVHGQTDLTGTSNWRTEWEYVSEGTVPVGTWLEAEVLIREGNAESGRLYLAIGEEGAEASVVLDLTVLTHHPDDPAPDGFSHWNPQKLYTSPERVQRAVEAGGSVQVYWDDFELLTIEHPVGGGSGDLSISTETGEGADTRIIGVGSDRETFNDGGENSIGVRVHGDGWAGGTYLGLLRFDLAGLSEPVESVNLEMTASEAESGLDGPILLYGLNDGFSGGEDGFGLAEMGEAWGEGSGQFSPAAVGAVSGDTAPGFDEEMGLLTSAYTFLESRAVADLAEDDKLVFSDPAILQFLEGDTDGLVTFAVHGDWSNGAEIRFYSKEGSSSNAPRLNFEFPQDNDGLWAGYPIGTEGFVDTDSWIGGVTVTEGMDWVWLDRTEFWIFLPESHVSEEGAWMYFPRR